MKICISHPCYSKEDRAVWYATVKNKEKFLKKYATFVYQPYIDGFHRLGLSANQPPTIELLVKALSPTGWEPVFVQGYISAKSYIDLIAKKKIPISSYIRSLKHIQYAPEPDLIHDLIGHLPMLFFNEYVEYLMDFCECFSHAKSNIYDAKVIEVQKKIALLTSNSENQEQIDFLSNELNNAEKSQKENPSVQYQLGKMFLWTIEFGLIKSNSMPKLYGAGLMSSSLEAQEICQGNIKIIPFSLEYIVKDFHYSDLQDQVFVADSFQSLRNSLAQFKNRIVI